MSRVLGSDIRDLGYNISVLRFEVWDSGFEDLGLRNRVKIKGSGFMG